MGGFNFKPGGSGIHIGTGRPWRMLPSVVCIHHRTAMRDESGYCAFPSVKFGPDTAVRYPKRPPNPLF